MKQCRICINREYKENLICCNVAKLKYEFTEILRCIPLFGKDIKQYECSSRIVDRKYSGFPEDMPVYCRCSINYEVQNES